MTCPYRVLVQWAPYGAAARVHLCTTEEAARKVAMEEVGRNRDKPGIVAEVTKVVAVYEKGVECGVVEVRDHGDVV